MADMLTVAVCDDEMVCCKEIAAMIEDYITSRQMTVKYAIYDSGRLFFEELKKGAFFDLIFLDIELGAINGVSIGKFLRRDLNNDTTRIAFVSSHEEQAMKLFDVQPLHFVTKPLEKEAIFQSLDLALKLKQKSERMFSYKVRTVRKRLPLREIRCFESCDRQIILYSVGGEDTFYESLDHLEKELKGEGFCRIHKSFLVNLARVRSVESQCVVLDDGKKLNISRRRKKEIMREMIDQSMEGESHE